MPQLGEKFGLQIIPEIIVVKADQNGAPLGAPAAFAVAAGALRGLGTPGAAQVEFGDPVLATPNKDRA